MRHTAATRSRTSTCSAGFTLLEILIALAILGTGFVTVIGLQSAAVRVTLDDGQRLRAAMIARRILAHLEAIEPPLQPGDQQGPPSKILATIAKTNDPLQQMEDDAFLVRLEVAPWAPEGLNPDLLKRVIVTVTWGGNTGDFVRVLYFAVNEGKADKEDGSGGEGNDEEEEE